MNREYIITLQRLSKKIDKINKGLKYGIDEYFINIDRLNAYLLGYFRGKVQILDSEREYLTFKSLPFTFDGEDRLELALKDSDKSNLLQYKN